MASANQPAGYLFPDAYLRNFTTQVFMHFGVPRADAEQAEHTAGAGLQVHDLTCFGVHAERA